MATLSLCMIVKNEEKNLARCLSSVRGIADEIVLVDTGSTDHTVDLAKTFGARILQFPWQGDFAQARNVGLAEATCEWILHLDADEELAPESRPRLKAVLDGVKADGLLVPVRNFLPPDSGAAYDDLLLTRLFRNRPVHRYTSRIHEQIMPSILNAGGKLGIADLRILHYGYMQPAAQDASRDRRNIVLLEEALAQDPQSAYLCAKLGTQYHTAGDLALAEVYLRRVLSLDYHVLAISQFQDVLLALGQIAYARQDFKAAIDCASDCLALLGHGNRAWAAMNLLADVHLGLGQRELKRSLTAAGGDAGQADASARTRQHFEQAQRHLNRLLEQAELNPLGFSRAHARLAQCQVMLNVISAPGTSSSLWPDPAARLQSLLAAEDLAEALQARPEWLDIELLTLVQANVQTAREQGELELAEGLETLADYVRDHLAGVPSERSAA